MSKDQPLLDRQTEVIEHEIMPVSPGEESGHITRMGDDMLALITKAAKNAQQIEDAYNKVIVACTFPTDWTAFGEKSELSSAGAERLLKHFPIRINNMTRQRRDWNDKYGSAYSWTYEATASMGGSEVHVSATYGSRDKFKGFVNGEWRDVADLNEGELMSAARHKCIGQAIKTLLGLRNIPTERIGTLLGTKPKGQGAASSATIGSGTDGGIPDKDREHQDEITNMLIEMANGDPAEVDRLLGEYTKFPGKDGEVICTDIRKLKRRWLGKTLQKVRLAFDKWTQEQDGNGPGSKG